MEIKIPDETKIPLKNYLLNLVNETDEKESSIYVNGVGHFIQKIWSEIAKNNWRKLKVRKLISERLGIGHGGFYDCKNGKKAISIQTLYKLLLLWREFCNKNNAELNEKWDEVYSINFTLSTHSKCQKTILPKFLSPKLSYLLGWMCGDGHLKCGNERYLIKISEKSVSQLEFVLKPLFNEIFNVKSPIFKRFGRGYAIQLGSKPIFRFLTQIVKVEVGKIPSIVKKMDYTNKKYFLAGVFDSEGYVNDSNENSRLVISQSSREFLEEIMKLFKEVDVNFTGPYFNRGKLGVWYTIQIRKKTEIIKFASVAGSFHIDKLQKLKKLVDKIEENWNR